jgi:ankyrin repeat protein
MSHIPTNLENIKLLEELGADLNQTCSSGKNALMLAAESIVDGRQKIIKYLHSKNDQLIHAKDDNGDTAIITLANKGNKDKVWKFSHFRTMELLKKLGAEFDKTDPCFSGFLSYKIEKNKRKMTAKRIKKNTPISQLLCLLI